MIKQSTYLRRVLKAALAAGWTVVAVDDGGDEPVKTTTVGAVMTAVKAVDEAKVFLKRGDEKGWLYCVWQGPDDRYPEGEEIISDYSVNLEAVVSPQWDAHNNPSQPSETPAEDVRNALQVFLVAGVSHTDMEGKEFMTYTRADYGSIRDRLSSAVSKLERKSR